jgi:hypothetical protein
MKKESRNDKTFVKTEQFYYRKGNGNLTRSKTKADEPKVPMRSSFAIPSRVNAILSA